MGGSGQVPLFILPGLLCDSTMFKGALAAFDAQVVDGFYGDAARIEAMADHALALMPARVALLGHSMGARVALEIWRRAPGRVDRLALISTGVHPVRDGEAAARHRLSDIARSQGDRALVDAWLPPMISPVRRDDADLRDTLSAMCMAAGGLCYARQIDALLHRPDAAAVLPTIDCPTVVVVGRDDTWSPVAQHEAIAAAIPGGVLRVVNGAGHMVPAEDPAAFDAIVREWLAWPADERQISMRGKD